MCCISAHTTPTCPCLPQPLKTANLAEVVPAWDASFVEVEQEMLFELILVRSPLPSPPACTVPRGANRDELQAANYLDIKPLLDLTCAKVATMMKGKTPEEIRKTFNIKNDFTPVSTCANATAAPLVMPFAPVNRRRKLRCERRTGGVRRHKALGYLCSGRNAMLSSAHSNMHAPGQCSAASS